MRQLQLLGIYHFKGEMIKHYSKCTNCFNRGQTRLERVLKIHKGICANPIGIRIFLKAFK
jgi:hypothetical protein